MQANYQQRLQNVKGLLSPLNYQGLSGLSAGVDCMETLTVCCRKVVGGDSNYAVIAPNQLPAARRG